MSYALNDEQGYQGFGCEAGCPCTKCQAGLNGYGETYVREDGGDEEPGGMDGWLGGSLTNMPWQQRFAGTPTAAPRNPPAAERRLFQDYQRSCRGVRVLQTLSRRPMTLEQRVVFLTRKLAAVPRLVEGWRKARPIAQARLRGAPERAVREALQRLLEEYPELRLFSFPPGYAVGSAEHERAIVRCELSRARWELAVARRTGRLPGRLLRMR